MQMNRTEPSTLSMPGSCSGMDHKDMTMMQHGMLFAKTNLLNYLPTLCIMTKSKNPYGTLNVNAASLFGVL